MSKPPTRLPLFVTTDELAYARGCSRAESLGEPGISKITGLLPRRGQQHFGCDEVWCLGLCQRCRENVGDSKAKAFITYVNKLIDFPIERGKTPIIWHDMLARCLEEELATLDSRAVVMIWL